MKYLQYLKYFFYIAFNWNFRLALFTIRHEIRGEKRYGIDTSNMEKIKNFTITGNSIAHAEQYQGSNYFLLENLFSYLLRIRKTHNIVDFGCGKGRVLAVAAFYGFNTITGVEFAGELCAIAKKNISPLQIKFPEKVFKVIHQDAKEYLVEDDANVFFFFNPFNHVVMLAIVKNILRSIKNSPRDVYVIYLNPVHKEIFLSAGFEEVYRYQKLHYVNGIILRLAAQNEW